MKRHCSLAVAVAAVVSLSACAHAPVEPKPAQLATDISGLPGPRAAAPEFQLGPHKLLQPATPEQSALSARRQATRALRQGVAGGERAQLQIAASLYEPPRPPVPEPKPAVPEKKPPLILSSLR